VWEREKGGKWGEREGGERGRDREIQRKRGGGGTERDRPREIKKAIARTRKRDREQMGKSERVL